MDVVHPLVAATVHDITTLAGEGGHCTAHDSSLNCSAQVMAAAPTSSKEHCLRCWMIVPATTAADAKLDTVLHMPASAASGTATAAAAQLVTDWCSLHTGAAL